MKQYHIAKNGVQSGPYSEPDILAMLSSGEIGCDDLCWTKGMAQWQPIRQVVTVPKAVFSHTPQPPLGVEEPQAINWIPALVFYSASGAIFFLVDLVELGSGEEASDRWMLLLLPFAILGIVFICMLHHKCWSTLPERFRFTTPGKAVGYLFIPFYNFYWAFITWPKLSDGLACWEKSTGSHATTDTKSLAVAYAVLFVSGLSIDLIPGMELIGLLTGVADLVIFILYYKQVVAAMNALLRK
jgi:hypothetical protein